MLQHRASFSLGSPTANVWRAFLHCHPISLEPEQALDPTLLVHWPVVAWPGRVGTERNLEPTCSCADFHLSLRFWACPWPPIQSPGTSQMLTLESRWRELALILVLGFWTLPLRSINDYSSIHFPSSKHLSLAKHLLKSLPLCSPSPCLCFLEVNASVVHFAVIFVGFGEVGHEKADACKHNFKFQSNYCATLKGHWLEHSWYWNTGWLLPKWGN